MLSMPETPVADEVVLLARQAGQAAEAHVATRVMLRAAEP
jgi:hypothetical protein